MKTRALLAALLLTACPDDGTSGDDAPDPAGDGTSTGAASDDDDGDDDDDDTPDDDDDDDVPGSTSTSDSTGDDDDDDDDSSSSGSPDCVDWEPWFHDGFEDYAPEQSLSSNDPFDAAGRTAATDELAYAGSQSARMEIQPGDNGGFGQWGGIIPLPDRPEGTSVWVRLWVRWPASFEFSASPWMKFLRLHNREADGSNGGYNDLYVDQADGPDSVLRIIKEVHNVWEVYDGDPIPRDTWERYEMQIVIDDVPVDDGGEGRFRVWRDDALIFDRTDVPTVTAPGGTIDALYIFTYWNNEMPPANTAYIDELTIAFDDAPPPLTDANGLAYIGGWLPCR